MQSVEDRLFARFRRTGDSRALGELFDRAAPDLLKVARYLCGDATLAEDLVQSTFIAAIEHASRHEAERRVVPWLVGILNHHAQEARRRRLRAARVPPSPPTPPADPARAAADAEFRAKFGAALRGLPEPYRCVVTLHLDDGLRAIDIGARLRCRADTARKQLARGLAMLRRALPPSLATGLVATALPGKGLVAVRRAVLESVARPVGKAAVVTASLTLGGILVNKLAVSLLAVAVVTGGLLAWRQVAGGTGPVSAPAVPSPMESLAATLPATTDGLVSDTTASPMRAPAGAGEVRTAGKFVVRGRCVDARSGVPVPDCHVEFYSRLLSSDGVALAGRQASTRSTTRSSAGGQFEFAVAVGQAGALSASMTVRHPEYVQRRGQMLDVPVGPSGFDMGDVALMPGCAVQGRVLDTEGRACAAISVDFRTAQQAPQPPPDAWSDQDPDNVSADSTGRFVLASALRAGRYPTRIAGRHVVEPRFLEVAEGRSRRVVDIVVRRDEDVPAIAGVVRDATGTPVTAEVRLIAPDGGEPVHAWTDRTGRFRLRRPDDPRVSDGPFRLRVEREGSESFTSSETYAWGADGIVVHLQAGIAIPFEVVDADSGEAILEYGVRCRPFEEQQRQASAAEPLRATGAHEAGRTSVHASRGRTIVAVVPGDPAYGVSEVRVLDVTDAGVPLQRFVLARRRPLTVRLVTPSGEPVAGALVEVMQATFGLPVDLATFSMPPERGGGTTSRNQATWIGSGRSEADGTITMPLPPNRSLAFRVLGPGCVPSVQEIVPSATEATELVVMRGALVRGVMAPRARLADFGVATPEEPNPPANLRQTRPPTIFLRRGNGGGLGDVFPPPFTSRERPTLDPSTCSFEFRDVPPGTWEVCMKWAIGHGFQQDALDTIDNLQEGEVRDVHVDLNAFAGGDLRFELTVDGKPASGSVWLAPFRQGFVDGVAAGRVRAGRYEPVLELERDEDRIAIKQAPLEVFADRLSERTLAVDLGGVALRLVGPDGKPVPNAQLVLRRPETTAHLNPSDATGRTRHRALLRGGYVVTCRRLSLNDPAARMAFRAANPGSSADSDCVEVGRIQVGESGDETVLRLPPEALR